jgi:hypothetical protein
MTVPAHAGAELAFAVEGAAPVRHAAVPTLGISVRVTSIGGEPVRSVLLDAQVQIAARMRPYEAGEQDRLQDLFGTPDRWRETLRTLPWTRLTVVVPPFEGDTLVELPLPCSYDLEVAAAGYLSALEGGEVPLELLFSGTVFYSDPDGRLQTSRISWESDADYSLPVSAWRETMDLYFPDSAWLRLSRERYDRLRAYRSQRALPSWDAVFDSLLGEE